MERERRVLPLGESGIEVREAADGSFGIKGTASVTRSVSQDLGGFTEEIAPGAYEDALTKSDVRGLYNHDANYVLGRSGGTMRVWADDRGMHYDIPQLPASRADVREAIQRGDVDGNSFSFTIAEGGDKWERRDGKPHRTITRFAQIFDVGPVTFPAYGDTMVSARSMEQAERMAEPMPEPTPEPEAAPAPEPVPAATKDELDGLRRRIALLEATQD